jgi:hypothetical protein
MSTLGKLSTVACLGGTLAGVVCLTGCRSNSPEPESKIGTHAVAQWGSQDHPVVGGTSAHYGVRGEGMPYVVWTDRPAGWGGGGGGERTADKAHVEYRVFQTPADGPRVEFRYEMTETAAGREERITINGVTYELAKGSLFLVSTKAPEPEVVQLNRDTLKLKPGKEALEELATNDAEVAAFFTKAKKGK